MLSTSALLYGLTIRSNKAQEQIKNLEEDVQKLEKEVASLRATVSDHTRMLLDICDHLPDGEESVVDSAEADPSEDDEDSH